MILTFRPAPPAGGRSQQSLCLLRCASALRSSLLGSPEGCLPPLCCVSFASRLLSVRRCSVRQVPPLFFVLRFASHTKKKGGALAPLRSSSLRLSLASSPSHIKGEGSPRLPCAPPLFVCRLLSRRRFCCSTPQQGEQAERLRHIKPPPQPMGRRPHQTRKGDSPLPMGKLPPQPTRWRRTRNAVDAPETL